METNSKASATDVTNSAARSPIKRWQPSDVGALIGPGIAITGRISSAASRAVRSEPERKAASTTKVAWERAAIIRLRVRKRDGIACAPGITSEIKAPFSQISANNRALPAGYATSIQAASTATVDHSAISAPLCAAESIP